MRRDDDSNQRGWRFEVCEERLALSAQPLADLWPRDGTQSIVEPSSAVAVPLVVEGHGWNDVAVARSDFGLRGDGQTVAIIDSGIAFDHIALGGGLGKAYRVVGGWDFAEQDADPYDDGPAGFHGTHVAGIVGASDNRYGGVAPDADLVALRVFDDQGNSQLTWVEQALQWVHQHKGDFANPITTVNLSLGIDWNSNSLPQWATLEDELKQLADDGMFISVAAGNSFTSYSASGLSYPAVSPYVTPIASVDAAGNLSRFSQRSERVLAAPGERIMSTLPDHFYGGDGIKNDWGAASGTSLAAPYVSGASVLVREAMQDLGFTQITERTIYDLFRRTADTIYDPATEASYHRLNLQRALDTLVGADDYGSTASSATALRPLTATIQLSGTIGRVTDQDFFQFIAARTGQATLTLTGVEQLAAHWQQIGGGRVAGSKLSLDVVAGQSYVVGVAGSGAAIGKYAVDMQLAAAPPEPRFIVVAWGTIEQSRVENQPLTGGDAWFQVTASRTGRFTAEAFFAPSRGKIDLEIFDAQQRLLGTGTAAGGSTRLDVEVAAGDKLYIHARGANPDVDFRLTNLVTVTNGTVAVAGTAANDSFHWQAGAPQQIEVDGISYALLGVTQVTFDGRGGSDTVVLVGGTGAEAITLRPGSAELAGPGYRVTATGIENAQVFGGLSDQAWLYDSAGNDFFEARPSWARLSGSGYSLHVEGFGRVTVFATTGSGDLARLYGSDSNDMLSVWAGTRNLTAGGVQISTRGFDRVEFDGRAGYDNIFFYTASSTSRLYGRSNYGWVTDAVFSTQFADVESILASVCTSHNLLTDLAALDFVFRRIGRN